MIKLNKNVIVHLLSGFNKVELTKCYRPYIQQSNAFVSRKQVIEVLLKLKMKIPPHKLGLVFSHYFVRQSNCTNKKHKITSYVSVLLFLIFSLQTVCLAVCIPASQGAIGCLEPVYLKEHMYECMLKCMHVYFAFFAQVGQIEATEAQRIMN